MHRLFITALTCLLCFSMFGEVIRADINYDRQLDKTTLIIDSINQKSLSIKSLFFIGASIEFERFTKSYINRNNYNVDRYVFIKSSYGDLAGDWFIIGGGTGVLLRRKKNSKSCLDVSIGLGVVSNGGATLANGNSVLPVPLFSFGTRTIIKNNHFIKLGIGLPELFYVGYGFSF